MSEKQAHKWADVIKAWADGEIIEYRSASFPEWAEMPSPMFDGVGEYRVKPNEPEYQVGDLIEVTIERGPGANWNGFHVGQAVVVRTVQWYDGKCSYDCYGKHPDQDGPLGQIIRADQMRLIHRQD